MKTVNVGLATLMALAATVTCPAAEDVSLVIPGGVTDAAGKVGYLTNPKGGIVAVSLEKGTPLWESTAGTKPLAIAGKRLVVFTPHKGKANAFRVAMLDVEAKGKLISQSEPIALPDWATVGSGLDHHDGGTSFSVRANLAAGDALVRWNAGTYYFGGAAPSPEILAARNKNAAGIAKVNLESGKVELLKDDGKPMPDGFVPVDKLPKEAQEVAQREGWPLGCVIGQRAYGLAQKEGKPARFGSVQVHVIQAVDLMTGELLWERAFEEKQMLPPPP
jgi:hypothetical protein